eukprot:1996656-Amphidinium_carterae.1
MNEKFEYVRGATQLVRMILDPVAPIALVVIGSYHSVGDWGNQSPLNQSANSVTQNSFRSRTTTTSNFTLASFLAFSRVSFNFLSALFYCFRSYAYGSTTFNDSCRTQGRVQNLSLSV